MRAPQTEKHINPEIPAMSDVIHTPRPPANKRRAMMVVLNLPCFSRKRCTEGRKGAKAYVRREKHQGRRDW